MESFNHEDLRKKIQDIVENEDDNQKSIDQLESLIKPLNVDKNIDSDIKSCMDHSFKNILLSYSKRNVEKKVYEMLIDLSINGARRDLCTSSLAIVLLTDLFECHTTSECEKLFDLIEKRIDVWKEELFFKNVKNQLLRTCNDLLRRLSRSQNTVFCGRILVFLANFFPFFERSGLNLISEFNNDESMQVMYEEDVNEFNKSQNHASSDSQSSLQLEDEDDGLIQSNDNVVLDFDLYKKFWSLQEYFRQPLLCFKLLHWKKFTNCANETIELFSNFKIDNSNCNLHALDSQDRNYFPKYLTSQKLLELQLCDSNFRRNILIQFLIVFQYLIGKIKFKTEQQTLNEDQLKWIKETTDKVLELITKTPTNGEQIKNSVAHILTREEFWSNWKNESCTELKKCNQPPMKKQKTMESTKVNLGERIRQAEQENKIIIGSEQLTNCWNLNQDNWNACNDRNRIFVPTIEEFFASVLTKEGLEYKHFFTEDATYCWRALRLLCRQSSTFFLPGNTAQIKPVKDYISNTIDKLSKDNEKPANDDESNNQSEEVKPESEPTTPVINNTTNSSNSNSNSNSNSEEILYNLE